jgi:hypothetical protein
MIMAARLRALHKRAAAAELLAGAMTAGLRLSNQHW